MVANTRKVKRKNRKWYFYKEVFLAALALISVCSLVYEFLADPSEHLRVRINDFDFAIAIVFLTDFFTGLIRSRRKRHFLAHNWYFLLASIPLTYGWAEALRGLRVLGLVRLIRATEHLNHVIAER